MREARKKRGKCVKKIENSKVSSWSDSETESWKTWKIREWNSSIFIRASRKTQQNEANSREFNFCRSLVYAVFALLLPTPPHTPHFSVAATKQQKTILDFPIFSFEEASEQLKTPFWCWMLKITVSFVCLQPTIEAERRIYVAWYPWKWLRVESKEISLTFTACCSASQSTKMVH